MILLFYVLIADMMFFKYFNSMTHYGFASDIDAGTVIISLISWVLSGASGPLEASPGIHGYVEPAISIFFIVPSLLVGILMILTPICWIGSMKTRSPKWEITLSVLSLLLILCPVVSLIAEQKIPGLIIKYDPVIVFAFVLIGAIWIGRRLLKFNNRKSANVGQEDQRKG
jgi:uncharacterized membrane protein